MFFISIHVVSVQGNQSHISILRYQHLSLKFSTAEQDFWHAVSRSSTLGNDSSHTGVQLETGLDWAECHNCILLGGQPPTRYFVTGRALCRVCSVPGMDDAPWLTKPTSHHALKDEVTPLGLL